MAKKVGIGSISLPIMLFAFWISTDIKGFCAGDYFLQSVGLKAWSNGKEGIHYSVILSIVLFFASWIAAKKYPNYFGAAISRNFKRWND